VRELGVFPDEPYRISADRNGLLLRDRAELARHFDAKAKLQGEVQRRLAQAPTREALLYVQGFYETFATAAYTAAELCHFLGREPVCAFFTWPASSTGPFLTSYTATTESADFAVEDLKKSIRVLLRWLIWAVVPTGIVLRSAMSLNPVEACGPITRIGLVIAALAMGLFFHRLLHPKHDVLTRQRQSADAGLLHRANWLWFPLLLAFPVLLVPLVWSCWAAPSLSSP
jgi:hypothetical protein